MGLTAKQQRFVDEYLVDLNATQAAIRAGYSEKTASETGYENLRKPQIAKIIKKAMEGREERTELTQDMVLKELQKIGFATTTDFTFQGMPIVDKAKYKTSSQLKALELIGKHIGMFNGSEGDNMDSELTVQIVRKQPKKDD